VRVTQRSVSSEGAGLKRDTIVIMIIIIKQKKKEIE